MLASFVKNGAWQLECTSAVGVAGLEEWIHGKAEHVVDHARQQRAEKFVAFLETRVGVDLDQDSV